MKVSGSRGWEKNQLTKAKLPQVEWICAGSAHLGSICPRPGNALSALPCSQSSAGIPPPPTGEVGQKRRSVPAEMRVVKVDSRPQRRSWFINYGGGTHCLFLWGGQIHF